MVTAKKSGGPPPLPLVCVARVASRPKARRGWAGDCGVGRQARPPRGPFARCKVRVHPTSAQRPRVARQAGHEVAQVARSPHHQAHTAAGVVHRSKVGGAAGGGRGQGARPLDDNGAGLLEAKRMEGVVHQRMHSRSSTVCRPAGGSRGQIAKMPVR